MLPMESFTQNTATFRVLLNTWAGRLTLKTLPTYSVLGEKGDLVHKINHFLWVREHSSEDNNQDRRNRKGN
eukprot:m.50937 g.50937  ORF g.50937 m.50937 type:complete len:71 (+) comp7541_c1_seq2:2238-2450(+)